MMKFLFQPGNKYGKGRIPGSMSAEERSSLSERKKKMWASRRPEMVEAIKTGMATPEVKAKLQELNKRKRRPMTPAHKAKLSDALVGKEPKNFYSFKASSAVYPSHDWLELGGKRHYMKSRWERNYARYLEWLKGLGEIVDWEYEPKMFVFEKIKFGNRTYRPDFKVTYKGGKYEWHEVKGWMDDRSRVKLDRMARYFPEEPIVLITAEEYGALRRDLKNLVPGWELGR